MSTQQMDQGTLAALSRVVAVINGKGGVLKTSITANVAGQLAATGMRILGVDMDVSGNLAVDLGLHDHPGNDHGKGVVDAVWNGAGLPIAKDVRAGLDLVFGGRNLELLEKLAASSAMGQDLPHGSVAAEYANRLASVAENYDLVLLDCPPGNVTLQEIALAAARWVLIPTRTDQASLEGLRGVGPHVKSARAAKGGQLGYLGVVVTGHNRSATRVLRSVTAALDEIGEQVPRFETTIRHSETAAHDCRERGQLAHELAADAAQVRTARFAALRHHRKGGKQALELPANLSETANSLAGDYRKLAEEICARIQAAEDAEALQATAGSRGGRA